MGVGRCGKEGNNTDKIRVLHGDEGLRFRVVSLVLDCSVVLCLPMANLWIPVEHKKKIDHFRATKCPYNLRFRPKMFISTKFTFNHIFL